MDEETRNRVNAWADQPFPSFGRNNPPSEQARIAAAAEYAAHHLGRISNAL